MELELTRACFVLFSCLVYLIVESIDSSSTGTNSLNFDIRDFGNNTATRNDSPIIYTRIQSKLVIPFNLTVNGSENEEIHLIKTETEGSKENSKLTFYDSQESKSYNYNVTKINGTLFINDAFLNRYLNNSKEKRVIIALDTNYSEITNHKIENETIRKFDARKEFTSHFAEGSSVYDQAVNIVNESVPIEFNTSDTFKNNFENGALFSSKANDNFENYNEREFSSNVFGDVAKSADGENYDCYQDTAKKVRSFISTFINDFVSDLVDNECKNNSLFYLQHLRNYTTWAVKMLDSTAKIPDGILLGNIRHLGNFDECITVKVPVDVHNKHIEEIFRGKYCLANLQFTATEGRHQHDLEHFLDTMTGGRRSLEITRNRKGVVLPYFALFEWAVCVPSTCTAVDLETVLNRIFSKFLSTRGLAVNVTVDDDSCYIEETFVPHLRDFAMMVIILIFMLAVGVGSVYDFFYREKNKTNGRKEGLLGEAVAAFSIPANLKKLLDVNKHSGTIECLDGIRFLTMMWVISTHKIVTMAREPWINKLFLLQEAESFWIMPFKNSLSNVDTFFVIGGMLRAYNAMNELEQHNFHYFSGFLQRYLRLTPAYGILIGFYATLLAYLGNGPTWKKNIIANSERCRTNWIPNMLYVNNYIDDRDMCMPHSWYLAADMQLFLLSPLIIYPMWKWKKFGKLLLGFLSLVSIAEIFIVILVNRYLGIQSVGFHDTILQEFGTGVYLPTHMRNTPYIVGLGLGCIFHQLKEDKDFKLHKFWIFTGWCVCMMTLFGVVFGPYRMMLPGYSYQIWEQSLYGALHCFSWGLAVSWIIFACHKGYGGIINKALSIRLLQPLSRLTYCAYLVHFAVIMIGTSKIRTALYMDYYFIIHDYIADAAISLFIAAILFLCVEQPFLTLTKIVFHRRK